MTRTVLIHEKDLGIGKDRVHFTKREIEETENGDFYCEYKNKKLKLQEKEESRMFTAVEVVR